MDEIRRRVYAFYLQIYFFRKIGLMVGFVLLNYTVNHGRITTRVGLNLVQSVFITTVLI